MNARNLFSLLVVSSFATLAACSDDDGTDAAPCPDGTVRAGDVCVDDSGDVVDGDTGSPDAGSPDGGGDDGGDNDGGATDGGGEDGGGSDELLVTEFFGPSGYFGEYCNIEQVECPTRPDGAAGSCIGFTFTPAGECEPGGEAGFGGVWWQNPDGNWGDQPGLPMPPNVNTLTFQAWGAAGGEAPTFAAGYTGENADPVSGSTGEVTLGTDPMRFEIDMTGVGGQELAGGFSWVLAEGGTIYMDDIRYFEKEATDPDAGTDGGMDGGTDAGDLAELLITEFYGPSGYFGEYCNITEVSCPTRPDGAEGNCLGFTWTPGGECEPGGEAGFAGVWFQNPDGNWGDLPGLPLPAGIDALTFQAWSAAGGETVDFFSGYDSDPVSGSATGVTLSTEPTAYRIAMPGVGGQEFAGGFGWGGSVAFTLYFENIRFVETSDTTPDAGSDTGTDDTGGEDTGSDTEMPSTPESLPVVVDDWFGPSGYFGEFYAITDTDCDASLRSEGAVGRCHEFVWEPAGNEGFAGIWWQNPDGNWGDQPGLPFPAGATRVVFEAWGAVGGERVNFGAGYTGDNADPANGELGTQTLGTEKQEYTITLGGGAATEIAGGFFWATDDGDSTELRFYVDNIRWE